MRKIKIIVEFGVSSIYYVYLYVFGQFFKSSLFLSHTHTHTHTERERDVTSPPRVEPNFLTHFTAKGGPSIFE